MAPPPRLAVLASGRGSNLEALIAAHARGDLPAPIALVVSNNSNAGALATARQHAIAALHISAKTSADPAAAIIEAVSQHGASVVVLAGYMKLVDPRLLRAFPNRVVNIHPAPLPRFGGPGMFGARVHEAVLQSGVSTTGPTVHLVSEQYDEGPVLAHEPVPVEVNDTVETLAARVLAAEHQLYWRVIRDRFCT